MEQLNKKGDDKHTQKRKFMKKRTSKIRRLKAKKMDDNPKNSYFGYE